MSFFGRAVRLVIGKRYPDVSAKDNSPRKEDEKSGATPHVEAPDRDPWESIGPADTRGWFDANSHAQHTYYDAPGGNPAGSSSVWNNPELLAVRVEYEHVKRVTKVSTSGLIEVWKGRFNGEDVTIRWLSDNHKHMHNAVVLATEAKTMARLSHPKITAFIGVAWSSALRVQIVTEFMDSGDLATWLGTPQAKQLTWADGKCQIAVDVAEAVASLHSRSVDFAHRDINPCSILVDSMKGAKLSGFSLSRFAVHRVRDDDRGEWDEYRGAWIALEVREGKRFSNASDVCALGFMLTTLDTYSVRSRAFFTQECPQQIQALALSCLDSQPSARPRAIQVLVELRRIQAELSEDADDDYSSRWDNILK